MARMIPPIMPPETPSLGEKEVFRRLKDDPHTENWMVLHSLDTAQHVRQIFGEVDFVIIVPQKGVLCLEIKGTTHLRREYGVWYYGNSAPDAKGPFKQASQAMHSVREYVVKRDSHLRTAVFWSAVGFPYVDFSEVSPEWHSWQVIDRRALRALSLGKLIEGVLDNARAFLSERPSAAWFYPETKEPTPEQCDRLIKILRPEFDIFESPKSRKHRLNEEVKRYTTEQLSALDAMDHNPRVMFTGPAGTGKTLLALEAARRIAAEGQKVLLLCFNRFLGKVLEAQVSGVEGIIASTLHRYMLKLANVSPEGDHPTFWTEKLPMLATERLLEIGELAQFDALIVDEAQDVLREPYLDFLDLSLKGGFAAGHWRIFGDFEKQRIYSGNQQVTLETFLSERGGNSPRYNLRVNCRNTPRIATTARYLGQLNPAYSKVLRPDNEVEAELVYYKDDLEQRNCLIKTLEHLYDDGFRGNDVVVLSAKTGAKACAGKLAAPPWSDRLTPFELDLDGQIGYCTIHAFKGLEADAVVVTDIEEVASDEASRLFYVAATRALHRLTIIARASAKEEITEILQRSLRGEA